MRNMIVFLFTVILLSKVSLLIENDNNQLNDVESKIDKVAEINILIEEGGRLDWCSKTNVLVYDRKGSDGYFDIYIKNLNNNKEECLTCNKEKLPELNNGNPSFHPSGKFVAFQSQDPYLITFIPNETHQKKDMIKKKNIKIMDKLVFSQKSEFQKELEKFITSPAIGINNNVWVMNIENKNLWQVTHVKEGRGVLNPIFSPDGSKLIWSEIIDTERGKPPFYIIKIAEIVINNEKIITKKVQAIRPNNMQIYKVHAFSPDGKFILISATEKGKFFNNMAIYKMELKEGKANIIKLTDSNHWNDEARYTPDGSYIIWASSKDIIQKEKKNYIDLFGNPIKLDYWIMNIDGSKKKRLTYFNDLSNEFNYNVESISEFVFTNDDKIIATIFLNNKLTESIILIKFNKGEKR